MNPKQQTHPETSPLLNLNPDARRSLEEKLLAQAGGRRAPIPARATNDPCPASFAQQRLWLIDQVEPGSPAYNIPLPLRLTGTLDEVALRSALDAVVARHEVLRTTLELRDDVVVQIVHDPKPVPFQRLSLAPELSPEEREQAVRRLLSAEALRPFDLANDLMIRATVVSLDEEQHRLLLVIHHVAADGWSMGIFQRELAAFYRQALTGEPSALAPLPIQYADFALWQKEYLSGPRLERQLTYWKQKLAGAPTILELPTDHPRPPKPQYQGGLCVTHLPATLAEQLNALAKENNATLFMTLLAAFNVLLARYSGQSDIVVGSPIANRGRRELEGLIGFFVNTLALRTQIDPTNSFKDLLAQVRETALDAYANQDMPFEKLVEELQPERSLSHSPLFQVMFILQNMPGQGIQLPGLTIQSQETDSATAKFDLQLTLRETGTGIRAGLTYSTELFRHDSMERMLGHFQQLLEAIVAAPQAPLQALDILPLHEKQQLSSWNATQTPIPTRCLHQLFEDQVQATPTAIALRHGDQTTTYQELDQRANAIAHALIALGATPNQPVAIHIDRSCDLIAAIVGILKAGAPYLPIDIAYPPQRKQIILQEADAQIRITTRQLAPQLEAFRGHTLYLEEITGAPSTPPTVTVTSEDLAYVIYTSGSTGKPKGVAMPHQPLVNLIQWQHKHTQTKPTTLQYTSISFDVSFQEIFTTLLQGATLVLIDDDMRRDSEQLLQHLERHAVERLFVPFVALNDLAQTAQQEQLYPSHLTEIITAGEQLQATPALMTLFQNLRPGATLTNQYGPTESHVCSAYSLPAATTAWEALPPIGKPIDNTQLYVLDTALQPTPIGVSGELYIAGACLAQGYFRQPELTAERFLDNPFGEGKLYKTGDLVKWLPDGNLLYQGRLDHQVKIRGHRIELGEIEAVLQGFDEIREAAVIAIGSNALDKKLVAYLVGENLSPATIRTQLQATLPEWMVPSVFVLLEAMPLSANGKIDRRNLPEPGIEATQAGQDYQPPRSLLEASLQQIWQELLQLEPIGIQDNFFAIGGHSLLATRVLARIRNEFGVALPVRTLFENPTIAQLAQQLEMQRDTAEHELIPVADRSQPLPLSYSQQRLWFLDQLEPGSTTYHVPILLRLRGPIQVPVLEAALREIQNRHEVLRTRFISEQGTPYQVVGPTSLALEYFDVTTLSDTEIHQRTQALIQAPFDLAEGPVFRATLLCRGEDDHQLVLTLPHIVTDGWSNSIFFTELSALYSAFESGQQSPLPELPIQYADYAAWQHQWFAADGYQKRLAYWKQKLAEAPVLLELPTDRPRPALQTYRGGFLRHRLSPQLSQQIAQFNQREGTTLFMTLLAAFNVLLARYSGQSDIVVGSPIANRGRRELEGLIGFFVNTLALRTQIDPTNSFKDLLAQVRETALDAYANQDMPFEKLVEELQPERSLSHSPLFQVMCVVQNAPRTSLKMGDVAIQPIPLEHSSTKFDLSLFAAESAQGLGLSIEYSTDLFDATTIQRMLTQLEVLFEGIVAAPETPIQSLPLLPADERSQVVEEFNANANPYPLLALHNTFEQQAHQTPDNIALVASDATLTYQQLDQRANQIANNLVQQGATKDQPIGIFLNRDSNLVPALMGTLKAGAPYLPLDPNYPKDRTSTILEQAKPKLILASNSTKDALPQTEATVLLLEDIQGETTPPRVQVSPDDLAYILYTSGSTGTPKGVAIEHHSPVALLHWANTVFTKEQLAHTLVATSICFDLSVYEIFLPLSVGATLHLVDNALALLAHQPPVTLVNTVPSAMQELIRQGALPKSVVCVNLAGEPLATQLVDQIYATGHVKDVFDLYGPSEDTTYSTWTRREAGAPATIGKPIANTQAYVLDPQLQPTPIGVPGELYLGGAGLARGYFHRDDLTSERFVENPFGAGRLYKTGDLVKWLPDGNLVYLGRLDFQVKLRGFRIELGEIESVLRQQAGVREALVVAREDTPGEKRLVGYVVGDASIESLRVALRARLPEWMVPSAFVLLEAFPLSPNGKVDRKKLPEPEREVQEHTGAFQGPRNATEESLAAIWSQLLGQDQVDIHSNFFEIGGHSLLAVRLIAEIRTTFGTDLPLVSLFQSGTIASLAPLIAQHEPLKWSTLIPIHTEGRGVPIFCAGKPNTNTLGFVFLGQQLKGEHPLYVLQSQYRSEDHGPYTQADYDLLAREYIDAMRSAQPTGPYHIIGACQGGHIAFEMARMLEAEGEEVALLGMLDTWPLENTVSYPRWFLHTYYRAFHKKLRYLTHRRRQPQRPPATPTEAEAATAALTDTQQEQAQAARVSVRKLWMARYWPGPDWVRTTCRAHITVFYTERQPFYRINDPTGSLGWHDRTEGGFSLVPIPGEHTRFLRPPHVEVFAQRLRESVTRVQA